MRGIGAKAAWLLLLAGLAACGGGDGGGADGAGDSAEKVIYAGSNWYGHAPTWVGIEQGIFAKHGFDVEQRAFGPSPDRVAALQTKAAQFASLGEVAMLEAMAAGGRDFYWIANQDIAPGNEGLVGIGIDSIADLKGQTIAINRNSSVHITAYELLKAHGLDLTKDVTVIHAPDSSVVDLVRSGEAVAGCIWEPFYTDLKKLPGAVVLGEDTDTSIYKRFKTMTGPDVVCASRAWVDADPERAKRFFAAYFEAVSWCKANPAALVTLVASRVGKTEDEVSAAMANFVWLEASDQQVVMSDQMLFGQAQYAAEVLVDMGLIDAVPAFREWTRPDLLPK